MHTSIENWRENHTREHLGLEQKKITPKYYVTCTAEDCEICLATLQKTPEGCKNFQSFLSGFFRKRAHKNIRHTKTEDKNFGSH
jgi:hypothetical protein